MAGDQYDKVKRWRVEIRFDATRSDLPKVKEALDGAVKEFDGIIGFPLRIEEASPWQMD
jgi:hypothetical protein